MNANSENSATAATAHSPSSGTEQARSNPQGSRPAESEDQAELFTLDLENFAPPSAANDVPPGSPTEAMAILFDMKQEAVPVSDVVPVSEAVLVSESLPAPGAAPVSEMAPEPAASNSAELTAINTRLAVPELASTDSANKSPRSALAEALNLSPLRRQASQAQSQADNLSKMGVFSTADASSSKAPTSSVQFRGQPVVEITAYETVKKQDRPGDSADAFGPRWILKDYVTSQIVRLTVEHKNTSAKCQQLEGFRTRLNKDQEVELMEVWKAVKHHQDEARFHFRLPVSARAFLKAFPDFDPDKEAAAAVLTAGSK